MRRGFTLVELMISSTILVIVVTAFASAVMGSSTLVRQAYIEAESSIQMRELRDRLLFHAAPVSGDCCWSGLISATNVPNNSIVRSGTQVLGYSAALRKPGTDIIDTSSDVVSQEQRIIVSGYGTDQRLQNNSDTTNGNWLRPGGFDMISMASGLDVFSDTGVGDGCYTVRLRYDNGKGYTRSERIVVPVFMKQQISNGTSGTYNNGGTL